MQIEVTAFSPLIRVQIQTPLQMEISLTDVNAVGYRRVTPTWFSEFSPCLLFLRKNQDKVTCQRDVFLGWQILLYYKQLGPCDSPGVAPSTWL